MRMIRNLAALCLALMMLCAPALAEAPFLMHADGWDLSAASLEVVLSANVKSLMPFDEDRLAMLQAVTNNLSLRLTTASSESSVAILVGQSEALTLSEQQGAVQISTIPGMSFVSSQDALDKLLGVAPIDMSLYGIRANAETLLDDGWVLLTAIDEPLKDYADRRSVKTSIKDMGTARSCTDYTVPKAGAEALKDTLLSLCPDGWLREIISGLTFSGKQTLRVYRTEEEVPLRMEYNGVCGPEGNLRTVKLIWRTRRDDTAHRDEITLTSPAKSGGNKNTLEFERIIKKNKSGALEQTGSFSYTTVKDKQTTVRKGDFELKNKYTDSSDAVTGSVTLQQKLPGESSYSGMTFAPDLLITGTQESPVITGSIEVTELSGKNVLNQAVITLKLQPGEGIQWLPCENTIDLDTLSEDELAILQQDVADSAATAIVRMLILLMQQDAEWFFRDLPDEVVQQIIDASDRVVLQ